VDDYTARIQLGVNVPDDRLSVITVFTLQRQQQVDLQRNRRYIYFASFLNHFAVLRSHKTTCIVATARLAADTQSMLSYLLGGASEQLHGSLGPRESAPGIPG